MLGPRLFRIFDEIVNDPLLLGGQPAPDRTPPTSKGADVHDVALQRVVEVGLREDGNFTDDTDRDGVRGLLVRQVLVHAQILHLTHASPLPARRAALIACGIPALLAAGSHWFQAHDQVRDVNHIDARMRIYPPALRLRAADKLDDYFNKANALRERANKRLADALADEPGSDGEN